MKSIQTRFLLATLLCMMVLSVSIGSASMITISRMSKNNSNSLIEQTSFVEAERVNSILNDIEKSVDTMINVASKEYSSVELFDSRIAADPNEKMEELFLNVANHTEGTVSFYFRYNHLLTDKDGFFYSKKDGEFAEETPISIKEYDSNLNELKWYYEPIINNSGVWSEPYYNANNNNIYMTSYSAPVVVNDQIIGVIGMDVEFKVLEEIVNQIKILDNGYGYLVDKNDSIVYHKSLAVGSNRPDVSRKFVEYENELSNGMTLVLRIRKSEINSQSNKLLLLIAVATTLMLAIAYAVVSGLTVKIIAPLKDLTEATQKVVAGDLNVSLNYNGNDEVGRLSSSFQKTIDVINDHIDHINRLAYTDTLTSLRNTASFAEFGSKLNRKIAAHQAKFVLIVLDMNNLKQINDRFGHEIGNKYILHGSQFISSVFKTSNIFRIGGDEFVVVLEDDELNYYFGFIDDFDKKIKEEYFEYENVKIRMSIAIGSAVFTYGTDSNVDDVFERADEKMYKNKKNIKS